MYVKLANFYKIKHNSFVITLCYLQKKNIFSGITLSLQHFQKLLSQSADNQNEKKCGKV